MRWLSSSLALVLVALLGVAGCGTGPGDESGGSSRLTMQFLGFNSEGIDQQDDVFATFAQVDVCKSLCEIGDIFTDIVFEEFSVTAVNAVFINNGKGDILIDSYTVNILDSGIDPFTRRISAVLLGGRCSGNARGCASDFECGLQGPCLHQESMVTGILLFDFGIKETIIPGQCPVCDFATGECGGGTKVPETFDVIITFTGTDTSNERFTIPVGYVATFFDADNCMGTTQQN